EVVAFGKVAKDFVVSHQQAARGGDLRDLLDGPFVQRNEFINVTLGVGLVGRASVRVNRGQFSRDVLDPDDDVLRVGPHMWVRTFMVVAIFVLMSVLMFVFVILALFVIMFLAFLRLYGGNPLG